MTGGHGHGPSHRGPLKVPPENLEGIHTEGDLNRATIKAVEDCGANIIVKKGVDRPVAILLQRIGHTIWNATIEKTEIGLLPPEYNKRIHGYYMPWRYYGKPDPISEVKLGELPSWFKRRRLGVAPFFPTWRWKKSYVLPRYGGGTGILQMLAVMTALGYILAADHHALNKSYRYHW